MSIKWKNLGEICFFSGVFLLSSTLVFSVLFLIISAFIGCFSHKENYFKDNWNKSLFLCGILIVISTILQNFILENPYSGIWSPNLSIIGLANWLPFFWLFWCFQPYLNDNSKRRNLGLILISGSFPVILSGFGQYFFNWNGPLELFNGLIVWYQKPLRIPDATGIVHTTGLTGLFSNQNYAGSWLNFIWPFCLAFILERNLSFLKRTIAFSFLISIGLATFLTTSRSALGGIFISLPIVIGSESLIWIIPFLFFGVLFRFWIVSPLFSGDLQNFFKGLINQELWLRFSDQRYSNYEWQSTRIAIMLNGLKFSFIRPFVGLGAASFPVIYEIQENIWQGHTHNLILELAVSYGIPAATILFFTILILLVRSGRILFNKSKDHKYLNLYDRAIWASIFFFLVSQTVDVQYFDGKISILAWILLACLKNIIDENKLELSG